MPQQGGSEDDDQELIRALRAGDEGAADRFVAKFRSLAIGLARRRFGLDPMAAQEIWQQVVASLWANDHRALESWRGEGKFSTYLAVIVSHACLRSGRRKGRDESRARPLDDAGQLASTEAGPEDRVLRSERRKALAAGLATLSSRDRLVLALRFEDGLRPSEFAGVLGVSAGAARKALHDARRRLRRHLHSEYPDLFSSARGNAGRGPDSHH